MTTDTSAKELTQLLEAAAEQRRLMIPWVSDKRLLARDGQVYYAIDTDIVKLYMDPFKVSITNERRNKGYAQVFPGDPDEVSIRIGCALAHHIFFRLAGNRPLLAISPIEDEIRLVFQGVARDAEKEQQHTQKEFDALRNKLIPELQAIEDDDQLLAKLEKDTPILTRFLYGQQGPSAELRRFGTLMSKARISPLAFAQEQDWFKDAEIREATAPEQDFVERVRLHDLREAWFERLRKTKSSNRRNVLIYDDAQVLARLQWINSRLSELSDTKRVVLITGDQAIHDAAKAYPLSEHYNQSFADLYLRHPRAFLGEPGVLSPEDPSSPPDKDTETETEFLDWLDTFLGEFHSGKRGYADALDRFIDQGEDHRETRQEMAATVLRARPGIATKFREKWHRYTRYLTLSLDSHCHTEQSVHGSWQTPTANLNELLERVEKRVKERKWETWQACFAAATEAGYGLLFFQRTRAGRMRPRNPPPLSFDSFSKAEAFVHRMLSYKVPNDIDADAYDRAIKGLRDEDRSGYTYWLAYALLFATEQSWYVAAILAERAIDIANQDHPRHISGREATYLRAVALRHSARKVTALAEIEALLDDTLKYWSQDKDEREEEGIPFTIGPLRFESEKLALWLTYHLFRVFFHQKIPDHAPSLEQLQEKLIIKLEELDAVMANERPLTKLVVERNLLTNLFMTLLLRWGQEQVQLDPSTFKIYADRLKNNLEQGDREELPVHRSFLLQSVFLATMWWMSTKHHDKTHWRKKLQDYIDTNVETNVVFPYGRDRFEFLRNLPTLEGH